MKSLVTSFSRTRQSVLLGAGFALLVLIGAASLVLVGRSGENTEAVSHTVDVLDKLQTLLLEARRAESSQRGFIITAQDDYRKDYARAVAGLAPLLSELRALTSDNDEQRVRISEVDGLIREKVAEMNRTIDLLATGQKDASVALVSSGEGRDTMERTRSLIESMTREERKLLTDRTGSSQRTASQLLFSILAVVALVIAIGALAVFLMQRSNQERDRAKFEVEATYANLETIIQYRTVDLTEANEEIQRFAYIVSHDLRSPLVNIMGFTTELEALRQDIFGEIATLRDKLTVLTAQIDGGQTSESENDAARAETLGKDFDEAISFIKASITKMDKLINAVLKLSREGRRQFKPEYIDMTAMIQTLEKSVTHQAQEAGATLTITDVPPVTSDRLALEQIFSNLLDNAVKYLKRGQPGEIEVTGNSTLTHAVYQVKDNGRGIDKTDHQRIFDLFRRAGDQDRPGEGIGLAHVRALVRRLGGTLSVDSELGKGSTFTVTLPRRWSDEQRRAA